MATRTSTGRVFSLLTACLPENETIKKHLIVEKISEQKEYRMLLELPCYQAHLKSLFCPDVLLKLGKKQLKEVNEAIGEIPELILSLERSIQFGNAWALNADDVPNFYDATSIRNLKKRIKQAAPSENVTNISGKDVLSIFTNQVIKDPTDILKQWTISDIGSINESIDRYTDGRLYCLPKDIFEEQRQLVEECNAAVATVNQNSKEMMAAKRRNKRRFILAAIVVSFCAAPLLQMPTQGIGMFFGAATAASIWYWVKG